MSTLRCTSAALVVIAVGLVPTAPAHARASTSVWYPQVLNVSKVCRDGIRFEYATNFSATQPKKTSFLASSPPVSYASTPPPETVVAEVRLTVPHKQVDIIGDFSALNNLPEPIQHRDYSGVFTVKWSRPLKPGATVGLSLFPFIRNSPRPVRNCHLPARNPRCGRVIKKDTTLNANLVNCVGDGLVIGAGAITVNLNGHKIDGTGIGTGINNSAGHNGVMIKNGSIEGFTTGVHGVMGNDTSLRSLQLAGNGDAGILLVGSYNKIVNSTDADGMFVIGSNNRLTNNSAASNIDYGIFARGSDNQVRRNVASGPEGGIVVHGSGNDIKANTVSGTTEDPLRQSGIMLAEGVFGGNLLSQSNRIVDNTVSRGDSDGILVFAPSTVLKQNETYRNWDDGIDVEPGATVPPSPPTLLSANSGNHNGDLGIEAEAGAIDGGGNIATGNLKSEHRELNGECLVVSCGTGY